MSEVDRDGQLLGATLDALLEPDGQLAAEIEKITWSHLQPTPGFPDPGEAPAGRPLETRALECSVKFISIPISAGPSQLTPRYSSTSSFTDV